MIRVHENRDWELVETGFQIDGAFRVVFRAEGETRLYTQKEEDGEDTFLCSFTGDCEVLIDRPHTVLLQVVSETRVWVSGFSKHKTSFKVSDRVFTSLDRPPPMSPEMRAVHEIQRRNEIERQKMWEQMERKVDAIRTRSQPERQAATPAPETPSGKTDELREDSTGGIEDVSDEKRKRKPVSELASDAGKVDENSSGDARSH